MCGPVNSQRDCFSSSEIDSHCDGNYDHHDNQDPPKNGQYHGNGNWGIGCFLLHFCKSEDNNNKVSLALLYYDKHAPMLTWPIYLNRSLSGVGTITLTCPGTNLQPQCHKLLLNAEVWSPAIVKWLLTIKV